MIVAIVNRTPGVGKTTLAVHLAGELARRGRRVALADAGLGAGALRWAEARRRNRHPARFETVGIDHGLIVSGHLSHALLELTEGAEHVLLDTPPSPFDGLSEVLAAADLALLPIRADGGGRSGDRASIQAALRERRRRPALAVRVVYTGVRRGIAPEVLALVNGAHLVGTASALRDDPGLAGVLPAGLLVQDLRSAGTTEASLSAIVTELFGASG